MQTVVEMEERRVCVGVIAGAHGVRGDVRVKSFTEDPRDLVAYGPVTDISGGRAFSMNILGEARGLLRAHIAGVDDRDSAAALAGMELYIERADLPEAAEDEFYHADLIGLRAEAQDGSELGTVGALYDFGGGDMIEIAQADGRGVVLAFTREVVPVVDIAGGRIVVRLPAPAPDATDAGDAGDAPDAGGDETP